MRVPSIAWEYPIKRLNILESPMEVINLAGFSLFYH